MPPSFESGTAIAAGDLNDDGAPDLVVLVEGSNYDSAMLTLFNKGKGRFAIAAADFVQVAGETITLAAIAGTNLDVLISGTNYEALFGQPIAETEIAGLLLNNGKGLFPNNVQGGPDSPTPYLTTGDFNGDGLPDIASISSAGLSILLDNGTAENLFTLEPPVPVSSGPVVAADFDLDDKLDVVVINQSTGELLLGEGNGRFQQGTTAFTLPSGTTAAISADMNGDGKPDIVTDMAVVVLGNGDGTFRAPLTPTSACGGASVAVADFNGDGKPDVLIPCFNGLAIFPGNGDGSLGIPFYLTNNPYVLTATTGDFNGDGIADVVFTSYTNAPIDPGILITVLLGNGDGAFRQTASFEVPGNTFEQNPSLIATDLNGDNYTDLAIVDATDSMVVLVPGNGDGTFGAFYLYGTASNPYYVNCIAAAEFQRPVRPGMPDLVFCSEAGVSLDLNTTR